jgi:hypothetical protein
MFIKKSSKRRRVHAVDISIAVVGVVLLVGWHFIASSAS